MFPPRRLPDWGRYKCPAEDKTKTLTSFSFTLPFHRSNLAIQHGPGTNRRYRMVSSPLTSLSGFFTVPQHDYGLIPDMGTSILQQLQSTKSSRGDTDIPSQGRSMQNQLRSQYLHSGW